MSLPEITEHSDGSVTRYQQGCRCPNCKAKGIARAQASRARARERAVADPALIPHGTYSGYGYYGCHCPPCNEAGRVQRTKQARATGRKPRAWVRQTP